MHCARKILFEFDSLNQRGCDAGSELFSYAKRTDWTVNEPETGPHEEWHTIVENNELLDSDDDDEDVEGVEDVNGEGDDEDNDNHDVSDSDSHPHPDEKSRSADSDHNEEADEVNTEIAGSENSDAVSDVI
ncbi:uncharacterized protein RAG0_10022 [Rhynchosporium agropyri]|uniref:Uncharacterized protein n=1 Tax=Rhynchosporium agropyri TaxID=914238 RepID=A0A1E1KY52_9HELO|nr:uncharacterized protein RAG0_10022 [Rhynchosporium agropyri]